ncbi:MAG: hypothetical protein EB116_12085 [Betaproteobacteria bacterium]|nr:hypothetical protein [Betaproteobacteria bacterium]
MIVETIAAAFVPVASEALKQLIGRVVGGVRPTTVNEQIMLMKAENDRLQAIAALDAPGGTPSQWVIDLRASARYLGALSVIAVGIGSLYVDALAEPIRITALEAANIAFGFLFGSRLAATWGIKK